METSAPGKRPVVNLVRLQRLMDLKSPPWGPGELASYSGVSYDTIYSIFKKRRKNTGGDVLRKIAQALGTTTDYLIGSDEDAAPPMKKLPETIRQLAEIAGNLSAVRQEELLRIAATLLELEREATDQPIPPESMRSLIRLSEELKRSGEDGDALAALESLLRGNPPRWWVDLRRTQDPDQPEQ